MIDAASHAGKNLLRVVLAALLVAIVASLLPVLRF